MALLGLMIGKLVLGRCLRRVGRVRRHQHGCRGYAERGEQMTNTHGGLP